MQFYVCVWANVGQFESEEEEEEEKEA